jgi:hypothetical protein
MASPAGRGAQVRLDGDAQAAARGVSGGRLIDAIRQKQLLESSGVAADGNQPDGSTVTGLPAEDEVLARIGTDVSAAAEATQAYADAAAVSAAQAATAGAAAGAAAAAPAVALAAASASTATDAQTTASSAAAAAAASAAAAAASAGAISQSSVAPADKALLIADLDGNMAGSLSADGATFQIAGAQLRRGTAGDLHLEGQNGLPLIERSAIGAVSVAGVTLAQMASETAAWAVADLDGNVLFGVNRDGSLLKCPIGTTTLEGSTVTQEARDDGIAFAVMDADRNLGLGVQTNGALVGSGIGTLNTAQVAAVDARITAKVIGPVDNRRFGANGDSLTDHGTDDGPNQYGWVTRGWDGWIGPLTGWRIAHELADNVGVSGTTSASILSRAPGLAAGGYGWIGQCGGGTNDLDTVAADTTIANNIASYEAYLAGGARVVATPLLPRNGWAGPTITETEMRAKMAYINEKLASYARGRIGMVWADPRPYLLDPATAGMVPAMTYDGLHTAPLGAYYVAKAMADAMSPYLPAGSVVRFDPNPWGAINPYGNLLTNGHLLGTAGTVSAPQTGVVPDGWATGASGSGATGGTVTWSKENPRADGQPGERLRLVVSGLVGPSTATSYFISQTILLSSAKYAAGDVLELTAELDKSAGSAGVLEAGVRLIESDGATSLQYCAQGLFVTNPLPALAFAVPLKTPRFTVRPYAGSGTASIVVRVSVTVDQTVSGGAALTAAFGRVSLNKVA